MRKPPNIILLVMDSVRAANMSCYGYHRPTTPNIDRLAAQSTLFEQATSVGSWTLPVHASLFTGLYPLNHGLTISKDALPAGFPTLAHQLQERGYQTACFSNNAYVSEVTGLTQGFGTVEALWRVNNARGTKRTRMSRVIKRLEQVGTPAKPLIRLLRLSQTARSMMKQQRNQRDKGAQLTNEKIKTWLTEFRDQKAPFFLFVNYMEAHEPYRPPYPYDRRFIDGPAGAQRVSYIHNKQAILSAPEHRRQAELGILQALYDGELSYLDHRIGELVQFIESNGILDESVLVITSDHGDSLGEHNHLGHRLSLYEPLVRVPLIIRYPRCFQPGERIAQQVSLIDLYPTFLELAGADTGQEAAQNDFHSLVTSTQDKARPFTIAENTAPKSLNSVVSRMLRTERYKYIWQSDGQHELYDLVHDPAELNNLVTIKPDVTREMATQLEQWERSHEGYDIVSGKAEYDDTLVEHLRALGYVE